MFHQARTSQQGGSELDNDVVPLRPPATDGAGHNEIDGAKWPPSFDQLLQAERQRRRPGAKAEELLEYADLRARYEDYNGVILDFYVCKNVDGAGSILTDRHEIRVRYPADVAASHPGLEDALWRANALSREGNQLLTGRRASILAAMVQSVFVYLLGILDSLDRRGIVAVGPSGTGSAERIQKSLVTAGAELDRIANYLRQATQSMSQKEYLLGMLFGLLGLFPLAFAVGSEYVTEHTAPLPAFIVVAGGAGAIISVMTRISSGKLALDGDASHSLLRLTGAARPLIGAVMALVVYVVILSGLVPVDVPEAAPDSTYLFFAIAFLAGFSERFAQDMLTRASSLAMPGEKAAGPAPDPPPAPALVPVQVPAPAAPSPAGAKGSVEQLGSAFPA
jgi:hypothetical protein